MEIKVLGPVEVWHRGNPLILARRQQRLVLGILALHANRIVSCDRIIDLLWDEHPPKQARAVVQTRISELRNVLSTVNDPDPGAAMTTIEGGYRLEIPDQRVDALEFRDTVGRWRNLGSDEDARLALRHALGLWRGPVLGGRLGAATQSAISHGLESARLTMMEDLFDIELTLGHHNLVVEELLQLALANPMRERLTGHMLLALHRAQTSGSR